MARTKRKRTRAEIERAWRDYQLANGPPNEPEEPEVKQRRLSRISSYKSRLNRELVALEDGGGRLEDLGPRNTNEQSVRDYNAEQQRARRAGLSQEARNAERERDTIQQRAARATLSQEEQDEERIRNTERRRELRAELTPEQHEEVNEQDRARRRAQADEAMKEAARIRRKCVRRGHALANHENFDKTKVSGKNVSNGHHVLPEMYECVYCGAQKWPDESKIACCLMGRVRLTHLLRVPSELHEYYRDPEFRKYVRAYNQVFAFTSVGVAGPRGFGVRPVREDTSVQGQRGVYTYRVQGAMGHYLGSLLPQMEFNGTDFAPAKFAQLYIIDEDMKQRALRRKGIFADLDVEKLTTIEKMMEVYNPFAQQFLSHGKKIRKDIEEGNNVTDVVFYLHADKRRPGTTNLPTVNEVGGVIVGDGGYNKQRDLKLYTTGGGLLRIFETNPMYDPLQYPLLFPLGELGWHHTDTYANGQVYRKTAKMSLREHVAYRLFPKMGDGSVLHQGGRLFQQWCVDQRTKVEQDTLRWISNNQKKLRADLYTGVQDAYLGEEPTVLGDVDANFSEYNRSNGVLRPLDGGGEQRPDGTMQRETHFLNRVGQRIILPSSYTGGPRHMYQSYLDSMAIVREFGKPDIFLTMTCNPEWEEIQSHLPEGQTAQDRPDIVARVWNLKLRALLEDLDEGVLGRVQARIYVVEFQKRGLPHAHILIILADEDKPRTREIIDKLVSAEIPDEDKNPELYKTVMTCMMHGPCGSQNPRCACMKDGRCTKGFPKRLVEVTRSNVDGYAEYRRRRRSPGVLKFRSREYDNETANQWVVPYNPYFSQKYNCHINVEVCTGITAVKYLYKYVYKGSDKAVLTIEAVSTGSGRVRTPQEEPNEVIRYLNGRYVSPVEACMRLLEHVIQGKSHSVVQLTVHLEGKQVVVFRSDEDPEEVMRRGQVTTLTRFFELCASDAPQDQIAKTMLYQDIPRKFSWKDNQWVRRKKFQASLGRMIHVSPRDEERFYLRVMLSHRRGPTSFKDLRTVNGVVCPSFKDAAKTAGYLDSDAEWIACMTEAATFKKAYPLRQLFATLLVYSQPTDVRGLWDRFEVDLSEDLARHYRDLPESTRSSIVRFETLKSIHELLRVSGYSISDFDLPQLHEFPQLVLESLLDTNSLIRRELSGYDASTLTEIVSTEDQLNAGQRDIYDQVMAAVDQPGVGKKLFFIDGPGGTGKSTLLRNILAKVRLQGKIAIAVASSGIASLLLMGGRTAHSTFKIPLKLNEHSTCCVYKQSHLKRFLEQASVVIWDEAPMAHRYAFEAVDRTLRDIMDNEREPFGGKVFVLSGDFRQILPVVKGGTPGETIDACLKSSHLWPHFRQVHLTENMRLQSADSAVSAQDLREFSEFLLKVGEGRHDVNPTLGRGYMKIPSDMLIDNPPDEPSEDAEIHPDAIPRGMQRLIDHMYADLNDPLIATDEYLANRTILTTTNAMVHRINAAVAKRLPDTAQEYLSNDSVLDDADGSFFEQEVLHTININGIPPHRLILKKGMPVMMMRNLNPDLGLCNGTRLRIVELKPHVIHAKIMTGERQGEDVLIPQIVFVSDDDTRDFPFRLRRKQFPVQPAFAMTINKAQGQTVMNLGLYLATPCFSHGQLYVALSRVTSRSRFKALIEYPELEEDDGAYTENVVYRQIFDP